MTACPWHYTDVSQSLQRLPVYAGLKCTKPVVLLLIMSSCEACWFAVVCMMSERVRAAELRSAAEGATGGVHAGFSSSHEGGRRGESDVITHGHTNGEFDMSHLSDICFLNVTCVQVYQPMLMEYFSYEELKAIKRQVMLQHSSTQSWSSAADVLKGLNLWTQAEELHKAFKYSDHEKTEDGETARMLSNMFTFSNVMFQSEIEDLVTHTTGHLLRNFIKNDYNIGGSDPESVLQISSGLQWTSALN